MVSMETDVLLPQLLAPSDLEDHLGFWLRRVSNSVSGDFARALQGRHASVAEWVALRLIARKGEVTAGELAVGLGVTRGAISKVIDKLHAKGWITEKIHSGDGRFRILGPTRAGWRALPSLAEIADDNDERFFRCLDAGERATLRRLLEKLTEFHQLRSAPTE